MNQELNVTVVIHNIPDYAVNEHGFMVARREDYTAELWFYGLYDTIDEAKSIAVSIGNGIVVQI